MHLGFVSIPAHGHVNPTLSLVQELVRRGHRVTYARHGTFRERIEGVGAEFLEVPGEWPIPPTTPDPAVMRPLMERGLAIVRDGVTVLEKRLTGDRPDALCYDAMTLAGRFTAERLGLPGIALYPTYASNEHFSLRTHLASGNPILRGVPEMLREMAERNAQLAADLGVEPVAPFGGEPASLNIVFIPREFQFVGDTFDDRFQFVGPSLPTRSLYDDWQPGDGDKPMLFISLGTVLNNRPDFFRTCLRAFDDGRWQVAMAIGDQVDPADLGPIPDTIEIRPYFPQPTVLRHADVFLSSTGMNSTMESLYSAVPILAVP